MDASVFVGSGLAILGSKDLLIKILGPSADYLGGEIKGFVEKCNVNLERIFSNAVKKLHTRINQEGSVSPRVLKHVVDEGRFCEDNLTAEYYGGILASSKSRIGRDDRGVTLLAQIKELSVYQLRFHYMAYMLIHRLFQGASYNLGDTNDCNKMKIFVPMAVYQKAMDFQSGENEATILAHCLFGLTKHNLLSACQSGDSQFLQKQSKAITESGIIFAPTLPGAELFLWAMGLPGASGRELVKKDIDIQGEVEGFVIIDGAIKFTALNDILKTRKETKKMDNKA